jgi:glycosyltransferase involved in cell wall biosynthesis
VAEGAKQRYAVVSYESRRDLEDPLRLFDRLEVHHFYRKTPWNDMVAADVGETSQGYNSPLDLIRRLRAVRPEVVQSVEPFALVTLPYSLAILGYVSASRTPLVLVSLENLPLESKYGPAGLVVRELVRPLVRRAQLAVYINEGARLNFLAAGAEPSRMAHLMYGCWGVDVAEFRPGPSGRPLRRTAGEKVVLFLGRVDEVKGIFDLLEAFATVRTRVPNVRLVIAGAGRAVPGVQEWIRKRGLEGEIDLLGTVKNRDVPDLMRAADVLAAPSVTTRLWAEQVGMVLIQAMACGIPVVSTTSGSIPEFVTDGENGLLVPEHDPKTLADALLSVLSDDQLRARLGSTARRTAEARFDAADNVRRSEQAVLDALGAPA